MRILVTTTTFQDTPGPHHQLLKDSGHEIVNVRGPVPEEKLLQLVTCNLKGEGGFDGLLHGNDPITRQVIECGLPQLKCLSKYGVGLDTVDVIAAQEHNVPVLFTPGVNHVSMAEHVFALILTMAKDIPAHVQRTKAGRWERQTGVELAGKTLGILGLGRTGMAVAQRAAAFEMCVLAYDVFWNQGFAQEHGITKAQSVEDVFRQADFLSLHIHLTADNRHFLNRQYIDLMKDGAMIINCARGGLIDEADVADACVRGKLAGYAADVLEHEPMRAPHPFQEISNILLTPHVAARTHEASSRQAMMAAENLLRSLRGETPLAQAA